MAEEAFTDLSAGKDTAEIIQAEKSALLLIARAEQCLYGLKCKLEKKKYSNTVIQTVLDRLVSLNLVNDRRYAELWLKGRINKCKNGPRFLLQLLRAKGIEKETAKEALASLLPLETETALLRRCLEKFVPDKTAGGDQKTAAKFFLKNQGFSAAAIEQYFEEEE